MLGYHDDLIDRALSVAGHDYGRILAFLTRFEKIKNFDPDDAEIALALYDKHDKVLEFLTCLTKCRELGFADSEIKESLLMSDCKLEVAIDYLFQKRNSTQGATTKNKM